MRATRRILFTASFLSALAIVYYFGTSALIGACAGTWVLAGVYAAAIADRLEFAHPVNSREFGFLFTALLGWYALSRVIELRNDERQSAETFQMRYRLASPDPLKGLRLWFSKF